MLKRMVFMVLGMICWSGQLSAATTPAALTGIVSSDAEGPMEGVVVSAKQLTGTITVTVISDSKGRYTFSQGRLAPGKYSLAIRAIGYDGADASMTVTVGKGKTESNIKLNKTADLAAQLSDAEWLLSVPGTDAQKEYLFVTCSQCHTLAPVMSSKYDSAGWMTTFARMSGWDQASSINMPVKSPDRRGGAYGNKEFAEYLSSINLSKGATHNFELKTLPRPKGADTKVIITEYDLPRPNAEPHDVSPGKAGMIWYQDFAEGILGRLNPATGEIKEWTDSLNKPGYPSAFQCLEWDRRGNIWTGRHDWNGLARFDLKTEQFTNYDLPEGVKADLISVGGDGTVWAKDTANNFVYRLDPETKQATPFAEFPPEMMAKDYKGPRHHIYGVTADPQGNVYEADIQGGDIFRVDGKTREVKMFEIPTPNSGPRRMHLDANGRLWYAGYYSQTIGMLDTKTEKFREWTLPVPWYGPYDVVADKDGFAWTGTMSSEIILRLNPKTGEFNQYELPRLGVNVRRVEVDNSGARPVFWVGENHLAKIARVEPLD